MKLVTLNIWGGHVYEPLLKFFKTHQDVDIFCLQEVYQNADEKICDEDRKVYLDILTEIAELLPEHKVYFKPAVDNKYGIASLVKNTIEVVDTGDCVIHHNPDYTGIGPTHSRDLQWVECQFQGKRFSVINVHGLWNGKGKIDSPERLKQARAIKDFLGQLKVPKILCGDFNLRPDTKSIKIISEGMRDLIKQYDVKDTRTSYYKKSERYADYVFASSEIKINDFFVSKEEVSDHAALFIAFDLLDL